MAKKQSRMGMGLIIAPLLLGVANSITSAIYQSTSGKAIKNKIARLQAQINEDTALRNNLMEAYNTKNADMFNNIMNSVPGSFAHQVASLTKDVKTAIHSAKMKDIDKNISDNSSRLGALNEHQIDPYNQITNAINTDWYNRNKHNLDPTKIKEKGGKFEITDQYGNKHSVTHKDLEKWTYGYDKVKGNEKYPKNTNTMNVKYAKGE